MKKLLVLLVGTAFVTILACTKEDPMAPAEPGPAPLSPVVFDPAAMPYDSLSTYNFFAGAMAQQQPVQGVLPYELITPLFTDYAHKHRFIWMPASVTGQYVSDGAVLDLPDGTILIKTFYYDHVQPGDVVRNIETRLMYRWGGAWYFADYVWNADQTEAVLDMNGSFTNVEWVDGNGNLRTVDYRIPAAAECFTCHKLNNLANPIGPKPRNLNMDLTYDTGTRNQLEEWVDRGYLQAGHPAVTNTVVRWDDVTADLNDRVRAYVDINCAHCHADGQYCDYRPMRFAWEETLDPTDLGVCVPPDDPIAQGVDYIVSRGNVPRSMMHYRINNTDISERMPLLGRTMIHEEAVDMVADWIQSLSPACQ